MSSHPSISPFHITLPYHTSAPALLNATYSNIFQSSFKSSKIKFVGLFSLKYGQRELRALAFSFEEKIFRYDSIHWKCYTPEFTKSRNSNSLVQMQIQMISQFEFAPRDTENLSISIWWISGLYHFQWHLPWCQCRYGVATIRRLLKITCLFCKGALQKRQYSAKETFNFKEPTSCSHPIGWAVLASIFYVRNSINTELCINMGCLPLAGSWKL